MMIEKPYSFSSAERASVRNQMSDVVMRSASSSNTEVPASAMVACLILAQTVSTLLCPLHNFASGESEVTAEAGQITY